MTSGRISVVIPVFRTEKYLEKCILSVLCQTYADLEIILVDDGSDDSCPEMCDAFAASDGRVKVIHKKNGGLSSARNEGINAATGEYIAFVDSDDHIAPDMYERLMENAYDADIVICSYFSVDDDKKIQHKGFSEKTTLTGKTALSELFKDEKIKNHVWNKLFRKELFSGVSFPEGKIYEDILTTYKLFEKSEKVVCIPQAEYYYINRKGAISKNGGSKTALARYEAHLERYMALRESVSQEDEGVLLRQLFIQARAYMLLPHSADSDETKAVREFFERETAHIIGTAPLNRFEKKQVGEIAGGKSVKLKITELFRKSGRLFHK